MTLTAPPRALVPHRSRRVTDGTVPAPLRQSGPSNEMGRYLDAHGRLRELVTLTGTAHSMLVVDRDVSTLGDRRLVAHLGGDEPPGNAAIVCAHYLRDPAGRWCRPLTDADLRTEPLSELEPPEGSRVCSEHSRGEPPPVDACGRSYRLGALEVGGSIPQLRWWRSAGDAGKQERLSVRDAVGAFEGYEPVISITAQAIADHADDPGISVAVLRAELGRVRSSPIVLNRGVREAVLAAQRDQGLSMSEIAMRCGRFKRDARGVASGETSWLARRLGLLPESGAIAPTPWIHSEVLGLIARSGLGLSPREVELG